MHFLIVYLSNKVLLFYTNIYNFRLKKINSCSCEIGSTKKYETSKKSVKGRINLH